MGPPRRGQASIVTDSESDGEEIGNSEEIGTSDLYNFMKKMKSDLTKEIHDSVKELNAFIKMASNLRLGAASKKVVAQSRDMIRK